MTIREERLGKNLMKKANEAGWPDDGEGAYEYIVRKAYELGVADSTPPPEPDKEK